MLCHLLATCTPECCGRSNATVERAGPLRGVRCPGPTKLSPSACLWAPRTGNHELSIHTGVIRSETLSLGTATKGCGQVGSFIRLRQSMCRSQRLAWVWVTPKYDTSSESISRMRLSSSVSILLSLPQGNACLALWAVLQAPSCLWVTMASNEKGTGVSKTTTQDELFATSSTDKGEFVCCYISRVLYIS